MVHYELFNYEQSTINYQLSTMNPTGFEISGVGLHSGTFTKVRVLPASPGKGRYFVRVDLPGNPIIPARIEVVTQTLLSTQLGKDTLSVRTVEHLLAALAAMGIDDARIEIDGPEVPLLDGSAKIWVEEITKASCPLPKSSLSLSHTSVAEPICVRQGDSFVVAIPASEIRFTYGIDFDLPVIGNQWYSWSPARESFAEAIAPARTFGLAHQIDDLRVKGLIKGGSLDNALVCDESGWINPPLRFANEPVRHKILDLVGDLSLLGNVPVAHYMAYKASHNLHAQLARLLQEQGLETRE